MEKRLASSEKGGERGGVDTLQRVRLKGEYNQTVQSSIGER